MTTTMLRQVSSRNQRTKGFRVKHFLQIFLLFAVLVWLIYQVKHSHDKKKAFQESSSKDLLNVDGSQIEILKFGRKDLPRTVEADPVIERRFEEEEDAEVRDVEREPEHQGAENEEGGGARDDRIDEHDQERPEDLGFLEDQDHEEGSHEAREKSFKGDDVSSAVVHDAQMTEHEDGSQVAQENSLKGDDASNAAVHDTHVTEHDEGTHVVREKIFKADDASNNVAHIAQVFEHEEGSQEAREKSFNGDDASSAVEHDSQVIEHEERSHEAQENSFRGDHASSAVVHDAQATEHEEESQEGRERSFKADDPASAVIHNTQVPESETEKEGPRSSDEKHLQDIEKKGVEGEKLADGTLGGAQGNDSSSIGLINVSKGNETSVVYEQYKTMLNNNLTSSGTFVDQGDKEVMLSVLENGSTSNSASGETKGNMEHQVDRQTVNVIHNQMELQTNSTSIPSNQTEMQTNSTAVLNNQMDSTTALNHGESQINLTLVDDATDGAPLKNQSIPLNSIQDQNAKAETARLGEYKSTLEGLVTVQTEKSNASVRPVETKASSIAPLATKENSKATQVESGNSLHNAILDERETRKFTLADIQSKVNGGKEGAAE